MRQAHQLSVVGQGNYRALEEIGNGMASPAARGIVDQRRVNARDEPVELRRAALKALRLRPKCLLAIELGEVAFLEPRTRTRSRGRDS